MVWPKVFGEYKEEREELSRLEGLMRKGGVWDWTSELEKVFLFSVMTPLPFFIIASISILILRRGAFLMGSSLLMDTVRV